MESSERPEYSERERTRNTASKYDFVKVKVWLGDGQEGEKHYYVLSRYLICRMLTVTKLSHNKAVKVAMELKKRLVDGNMLGVSQAQLESILFGIMEARGFGEEYIKRYKMVSKFFQQRRPLIILISGVPCTGKSTIAQALASRLNLPNVLQTDVIYELLQGTEEGQLHPLPVWRREDLDNSQLIAEFQREARVIRKGVSGDLVKTIRDGKPIIIEGTHIDPGLYLYEFGHHGMRHLEEPGQRMSSGAAAAARAAAAAPVQPDVLAAASPRAMVSPSVQLPGDPSDVEASSQTRQNAPALRARGFQPIASFALSYSQDDMHPCITPAEQSHFTGWGFAPIEMRQAGPDQVAGSPGLQWLQHLGVADSRSSLERGRFSMLPSATAWLSRKSRQLLGYLPSDQPASDRTVSTAPQEAAADRGQSVLRDSTSAVAGDDKALSHRGFASSDKQRLPELPGLVARAARQDPLQDDARQQAIGNVSNADRGTPDIARASQGDRNDTLQQPVITTASQRRRAADVGLGNGLQTSCSAEPESPRIPSSASSHKQDLTASAARRKPLRCLNSSGELGQLNSLAVAAPGEVIDFCEADHSPWQRVLAESPSPAAVERQQEIANSGAWVSAQRAAPGSDWVQVETQSSISSALADGQPGEGPVFVPIVMSMDPHDHATLVEQWHSRLQTSVGGAGDVQEVQMRLRLLQDYLSSYASCNVPVVHTTLMGMSATMDMLHDYLLECIALQMQEV